MIELINVEVINWGLTGIVGVLLAFVVFYLKETFVAIKELGKQMNKAFLIMQQNKSDIDSIRQGQSANDKAIEQLHIDTDKNGKDIAVINEKIKDL